LPSQAAPTGVTYIYLSSIARIKYKVLLLFIMFVSF
jgi:hypothetical protein